jgi:hypothetical protein
VARKLGIGRSTLYRKVKEHGLLDQLEPEGFSEAGTARVASA